MADQILHPGTKDVVALEYAPRPQTSRQRAILSIAAITFSVAVAGTFAAYQLFLKPAPPPKMLMMSRVPARMFAPATAPATKLPRSQ